MKKDAALYDLSQNMQGELFQRALKTYLELMSPEERAARPSPPPLLQLKGGYAESPAWMLVQALEFYPEGLSVERFRRRAVYSSPSLTLALLELITSEKFFDRKGTEYHLTDLGLALCERIKQNRIRPFENFAPLPSEQLERLENLMQRIIEASLASTLDTWSLAHSRRRAPSADSPALAKVMQYCSDLNAIRDDAHMAAYGAYAIQGHVWEAFSMIASGQAHDAQMLYEQLAYRGFYTEDWQAALDELLERGYLTCTEASYATTPFGEEIQQAVETKTNALFYAAWDCLSSDEFDELVSLMQALEAACQASS